MIAGTIDSGSVVRPYNYSGIPFRVPSYSDTDNVVNKLGVFLDAEVFSNIDFAYWHIFGATSITRNKGEAFMTKTAVF